MCPTNSLHTWNISSRRSRKSGCSNIFTGLNMHQLHRLFRTAGERNAEHRAKLDEEEGEDTRLAEALVGLKVRARNKAGIRVEGWKDHKWNRALGYLRFVSVFSIPTQNKKRHDV
uniref:Arginine vasopressin-induced protein 1 n=1 Tax=Oreochromis niloticus TaxID=8128 RepID=A0A669DBA1_ORENI